MILNVKMADVLIKTGYVITEMIVVTEVMNKIAVSNCTSFLLFTLHVF